MKKILMVAALAAMGAGAAPVVEITSVQQQYPWTNTVDITYTSTGIAEDNTYYVVFKAQDSAGNEIDVITNALKVSQGSTWVAQWQPPFNVRYENCTMTPYVYKGGQDDYMVVDLETWQITFEGMSTQDEANAKYNTNTYKTRYLVLRKIPAGDYTIGHTSVSANQPHTVNFPKDYWLGIFEVTKAQYARVVNNDKTSTDTTAQNYVTWNTMRNSAGSGSKVLDSGSFFGRLNNNTKNTSTADPCTGFDLPTISMAETANRAGLLSKYYTGETTTGLDEYANFASNVAVGSKKPNAWGFYDMIGNMRVPCRDTANTGNLATLQPNGLLPITSGTAANPILYGSSTYDGNVSKNDYSQLSFYGTSNAKSASYVDWGIRVAYIPE